MIPVTLEIIQFIAWTIALIEVIVSLYILAVDYRSPGSRSVAFYLLVSALSTYLIGMLSASENTSQAVIPSIFLAFLSPINPVLLLLVTLFMLQPSWLLLTNPQTAMRRTGWPRYIILFTRWMLIGLMALPIALTFSDIFLGTQLYYTGIDGSQYRGGYILEPEFTSGSLAAALK